MATNRSKVKMRVKQTEQRVSKRKYSDKTAHRGDGQETPREVIHSDSKQNDAGDNGQ